MCSKLSKEALLNCTAIFYQFFGTFILTITLSGAGIWGKTSQSTPLHFDAVIAFFTIWFLVIVTGRVSYAQFNPALTFIWMFRSDKGHFTNCKYGIPFFIVQFFASIFGSMIVCWIKGQVAYPKIPEDSDYWKAAFFQILSSFTLITMILLSSQKATRATQIHAVNGAMIGLGLIVSIFISQGVSGAGINPAVSLGTTLGEFFRTGREVVLKDVWVYLIFPPLGALVALLFHQFNVKKVQQETKDDEEHRYHDQSSICTCMVHSVSQKQRND